EPAVAGAIPRLDRRRTQEGKAPAQLRPGEDLDVVQPPVALAAHAFALPARRLVVGRDPQVTLRDEPEIVPRQPRALAEVVEELDAFPDQRQLFGIVELEAESAGRRRGAQRSQGGTSLEYHGTQSGARREERGRDPDDASADDHQVGGRRWFGGPCRARPEGHR